MNVQDAVAQLKEVMSAPTVEVKCVVLRASGETEEITIDQRNLKDVIKGVPTVVGGVRKLDLMAVARNDKKGPKNKHTLPDTFEANIKGDIVLCRTDDDAAPLDLPKKDWCEWVAAGMIDDAQEEDDDEEEEVVEGDEEEVEGEEDDDEEDDDEEEDETGDKLDALPISELKKGCRMLGISEKGTREELLARLRPLMDKEDEDEESDEEESDEEDDDAMLENIKAHLSTLDKKQLKEACAELKLDASGSQEEMLERILEHTIKAHAASKAAEDDSDDSDDSDESDEEADAPYIEEPPAPTPAPTSKTAGKQPVAGASKTIVKKSKARAVK